MHKQIAWVFICLTSLVFAQRRAITCHSSPAEIDKPVDLTFTLPDDPSQTKRNFTIYHYNDDTFRNAVLQCPFMNTGHFCIVAKGYSFDWEIAKSFVLQIPSLSTAQTGFYACQLSGYDAEYIKPCRVTAVKDADFQCSRKASRLLCTHGVQYDFESPARKNFSLDVPSVSADTVSVYSCALSRSYKVNDLSTKTRQGTMCRIHGEVSTSKASLTCIFQADVFMHQENVAVYRYTLTSFPDIVVNCTWINYDLQCFCKPGYLWNQTSVRDHLTIFVPWDDGHKTMYACEVQGYNASHTKSCSDIILTDEPKTLAVLSSTAAAFYSQPSSPGGYNRNVSCQIPSAHQGTVTWLTCQFPENISMSKKNIVVNHRFNQGSNEVVAFCSWINTTLQCIAKTGYLWDSTLSTYSIAIRIPRVAHEEHAGQYSCALLKGEYDRVGQCHVTLEPDEPAEKIFPVFKGSGLPPLNKTLISTGTSATCSPTTVTEGQQATVACKFGEVMKTRSFLILRYNANNTSEPEVSLVCLWTTGGLECEALQNYEYEIIVDNYTAILRLPAVTSEQLGTYTCKSVTSHVRHGSCTLAFPAAAGSQETETFFGRYKVYISTAVSAILSATVAVICVIIIYKRGHTKYERPQRRPVDDTDSYRKLDPTVYCKNTGIDENNSLYEEVRESPPFQRRPRPVTVSSARRVPGEDVAHISDVTSRADDKDIPPPLSPRLRPEDSSAPEGEKNPTSPATHPSERPARAVRHSSSSHYERDQGSASPPDPSRDYLHPVQHAVCAVSQENVRQSRDISPASLRDAKMLDERRDQDCRQVVHQSAACLQPANVSGNSGQTVSTDGFSQSLPPENLRSVYENNNGS